MEKNTWKVREFCQSRNVGTMRNYTSLNARLHWASALRPCLHMYSVFSPIFASDTFGLSDIFWHDV